MEAENLENQAKKSTRRKESEMSELPKSVSPFPFRPSPFEDYQPLDNLRASYGLSAESFHFLQKDDEPQELFATNKNNASTTAMAFVVYSLVPFLGILFIPGAFVFGSIGLVNSYRFPDKIGLSTSVRSLIAATIVVGIQVFLWWLLYLIPELKRF